MDIIEDINHPLWALFGCVSYLERARIMETLKRAKGKSSGAIYAIFAASTALLMTVCSWATA